MTTVCEQYEQHLGVARARLGKLMGELTEVSSEGSWVVDAEGERYLNCGGYGVFLIGHCHPKVVAAVRAQIAKHPISTRLLLDPLTAQAASDLAEIAPQGLERVYFATSGAEAVEVGLKLGRATDRRRIVAAVGGYHGKTLGALSATGRPLYRDPFKPLLPDVEHVPFGDHAAIAEALSGGPPSTVILEPIQGEAGVVIPPAGYLGAVKKACVASGSLLMFDEIQTGLGRTGSWWASERDGVVPDLLLAGKTLSGGVVPVAAVIASPDAFVPLDQDPFIHSSTFSGTPIAAAAAIATLEVLKADGLVQRSALLGAEIKQACVERLRSLCADRVQDIRGEGLLIAMEFIDDGSAAEFMLDMLDQGVITNHALNAHRVVRLTPPATMEQAEVQILLDAVEVCAERLASPTSIPA